MGLDMYLDRMPRYKGCGAQEVLAVENYLSYREYLKIPDSKQITFEEWCGRNKEELPSSDVIDFYSKFYSVQEGHVFSRVTEEIGYWRKANAVHNWFVNHIQDGVDDCRYHREITADDLRELRDVCEEVIKKARLIPGKIHAGTVHHSNGTVEETYESGKVVSNPSVCERLMPAVDGFFFGSTAYNEYYIEDLRRTIEICESALDTTDFDKQMIYYCSSW